MDGIEAAAEQAGSAVVALERMPGAQNTLPLRIRLAALTIPRRDVIERADLIVLAPAAPVPAVSPWRRRSPVCPP